MGSWFHTKRMGIVILALFAAYTVYGLGQGFWWTTPIAGSSVFATAWAMRRYPW